MQNSRDLDRILSTINNRGYKAYKEIENDFDFGEYLLFIDHVQADPFASPSRMRVRLPRRKAAFPDYSYKGVRMIALENLIARTVRQKLRGSKSGSGNSGQIYIDAGGQEVVKRTAVKISASFVELRLSIGLPAAGRRVIADAARRILFEELPRIVKECMYFDKYNEKELQENIYLYEDQEYIRTKLKEMGLVAFIANDSILPRRSGNSDLPLERKNAVPFISPESMEVKIESLHHGSIIGMGIKEGVSLIVGGGYHGKTTLLKAIQKGVYNHRLGDGREWVISTVDAVKIRAEDGRSVEGVNISPFIDKLPMGVDTKRFSSSNASGSTSQAANIMEAVELGASLLLLDEDSSATNFMIRDARMQALVPKEKEPITPFIDRIRQLYDLYSISSLLVIGGAGDYLEVADRVIMMDKYIARDVSEKARLIAEEMGNERKVETNGNFDLNCSRILHKSSSSAINGRKNKVSAKGLETIAFGEEYIDLAAVEQLVDSSQTRAIADSMKYLMRLLDGQKSLAQLINEIYGRLDEDFALLSPYGREKHPGDLAMPRKYELAAAINRLRSLKIMD